MQINELQQYFTAEFLSQTVLGNIYSLLPTSPFPLHLSHLPTHWQTIHCVSYFFGLPRNGPQYGNSLNFNYVGQNRSYFLCSSYKLHKKVFKVWRILFLKVMHKISISSFSKFYSTYIIFSTYNCLHIVRSMRIGF